MVTKDDCTYRDIPTLDQSFKPTAAFLQGSASMRLPWGVRASARPHARAESQSGECDRVRTGVFGRERCVREVLRLPVTITTNGA
eukprot:28584-Eustigmatos_ZCMA.PRE.1